MARINIEESWWTDPRRRMLARLVQSEAIADGIMVGVWRIAQQYRGRDGGCVPHHIWETIEGGPSIIQANLASIQAEGVYVRGSGEYLDWVVKKRAIASEGGKKSAQRPRNSKGQLEKTSKQKPSKNQAESKMLQPSGSGSGSSSGSSSDSGSGSGDVCEGGLSTAPSPAEDRSPVALTWEAYKNAYEEKYRGSEATKNATVMGQLAHFVKRVPAAEAPAIAAFYLTHKSPKYVNAGHAVGLLLMDAEKLRGEWQRGARITSVDARNAEFADTLTNQLKRLGGQP